MTTKIENATRKLNGWHRIGLIATVVWIFWSYNHQVDTETQRFAARNTEIEMTCLKTHEQAGETFDQAFPSCDALGVANGNEQRVWDERESAEKSALFNVVVTTLLAWGFVYLVIFLVRWVKRGFTGPRA